MKGDAWDGGHHIPFIAKWPGHVPVGTVSNELICQVDFMATVAAITGTQLPADAAEDSFNLLPALQGKTLDKPIRPAVVHHSQYGLFCIRDGKWKLILGLGAGGFSGRARRPKAGEQIGQLYDMQADPREKNNVYNEHPELVAKLTAILDKYKETGRSNFNFSKGR
jgi:arylsulfatase A-like enzyme